MYVTHDQVEAMIMGHRVCVLLDGVLQQVDTPRTLYHRPANVFVAGFIGSPAMNIKTDHDGGMPIQVDVVEELGSDASSTDTSRWRARASGSSFAPRAGRHRTSATSFT